jgi:hypothetical protein
MARDFYDREIRVGSAVEVLSGEDMNSRAKVVSVQGEYVLVELSDGATLRLLGRMVQLMETKMAIGHLPPAGLADAVRMAQAKLREAREWLKAARNAYMKNPSQETAAPATALAKQVKALEDWLESVGASSMERTMAQNPVVGQKGTLPDGREVEVVEVHYDGSRNLIVIVKDKSGRETKLVNGKIAMDVGTAATCPYCVRTFALVSGGCLPAHRVHGGVCDGADRAVGCLDSAGRAVFVAA